MIVDWGSSHIILFQTDSKLSNDKSHLIVNPLLVIFALKSTIDGFSLNAQL